MVLDIIRTITSILAHNIGPATLDVVDRSQQAHQTLKVVCWHRDEAGTAIDDGAVGTRQDFDIANDGLLHINSPEVSVGQLIPG